MEHTCTIMQHMCSPKPPRYAELHFTNPRAYGENVVRNTILGKKKRDNKSSSIVLHVTYGLEIHK